MATNVWRGDAPVVAQVNIVTPASVGITNTFTLAVNGKNITYVAATTTVAEITAGLVAAIASTQIPEFLEIVAVDNSTSLTLTARTAGIPFVQTSSATGGTATLTTALTTASSGANDWATVTNWSLNALPATGDTVYLTRTSSSILYSLPQSGVTLAALLIDSTFTGQVGLQRFNPSGYYEYRPTYLQIGVTALTVGGGTGSGSGRLKIDLGAAACTVQIIGTGTTVEQGMPALVLKGTNAANTLNALQGDVGVAVESGDVSTLSAVRIGYQTSRSSDVTMSLGAGCTLTTIAQNGGLLTYASNVTTHSITGGGSAVVLGATNIASLDIERASSVSYQGTGTLTAVAVGSRCSLTFSQDPRARTITNLTLDSSCSFSDGAKTVTFTNPFLIQRCGLDEMTLDLGANFYLQRS